MTIKRIALMTGGGDCAGLNAFLAAVARRARTRYGIDVIGIRSAFEGACSDHAENEVLPMGLESLAELANRPSTILGSSRFAPFSAKNRAKGYPEKLISNLKLLGVDAVVLTGGDDTLRSARELDAEGIPVMAAPKGIDNDLSATDVMLGYATAVNFGAQAVRGTVESARTHRRISVVEAMGRDAGWLAMETGIGGGSDVILIPERPVDLTRVIKHIGEITAHQGYCNIVAAEGIRISPSDPAIVRAAESNGVVRALLSEEVVYDDHGNPKLGGVGQILRRVIVSELGLGSIEKVRAADVGFVLRGQAPIAADVILGTRFGIAAVDLLLDGVHGHIVGARGTEVKPAPLSEALVPNRVDWTDDQLESVGVAW